MPKDIITATVIDNGPEDVYANVLKIAWGPKGGAPESPNGWVNAGYAHLSIERESGTEEQSSYVELDAGAMDRLIRTLKRIRRQTFRA